MEYSLQSMRHTGASILASAVCDLFPAATLISGESHEWGFYYDFLIEQPIDSNFIAPLEEAMRGIIKENLPIQSLDMMRENAAHLFLHRHQPIIAEQISDTDSNIVQICRIGDFYDYIPGKGVAHTSEVGAIKICDIARIEVFVPSLGEISAIRIQGTSESNPQSLKKFLKRREAAKKFDHTLIGPECELFINHPGIGITDWIWLPKGLLVKQQLKAIWHEEALACGAQFVECPTVCQSGFLELYDHAKNKHTDRFPEFEIEGHEYQLSPLEMRAYFHGWSFQLSRRHHTELPLKFTECAQTYTAFPSSKLAGLFRKRSYTTDILHSFCQPSQLLNELISSLHSIHKIINMVPFECRCRLVTSDQKRTSRSDSIARAAETMKQALADSNITYECIVTEENLTGPRIEFHLCDALGREWVGPSLEINVDLPKKMQLSYVNTDGIREQPVMVAQSLFGSLDAFVALLIEQGSGELPFWLTPEQTRIIPLGIGQMKYANEISVELRKAGLRVGVAKGIKPLGEEIHLAERQRIPYMIIIGSREENNKLLSVRICGKKCKDSHMSLEAFLSLVKAKGINSDQNYKQESCRVESQQRN